MAGTLHITTRRLVWFGDGADCAGYEVPFTSLTMHAVSRGAEDGDADFTSPCIYAQVEGTPPEGFGATIAGGGGGDDRPEEAGDDDDEEGDEDDDDDDDGGGFFYDEDEVMRGAGAEGRRAALDRFDEMLRIDPGVDDLIRDDPGRFEDDDDEEVK